MGAHGGEPTFEGMNRGLRLVMLAAALALVAAGCGGATGTTTNGDPISFEQLSQAATSSAGAASARFEFGMTMNVPGGDEAFSFAGKGAFDGTSDRASLTLDMSSFAALLRGFSEGLGGTSGSGSDLPDFDNPDLWTIDVVQDGLVMYMRFPALAEALPDGASWVRVDVGKAAAAQGLDLAGLQQFTSTDPRKLLEYLQGVSGDVAVTGTETVRGVETTRYRGTIDIHRYLNLVPEEKREEVESLLGEIVEQSGIGQMPFDVWIDGDGLVRKLEVTFSATEPGASSATDVSLTFELYEYGEDLEIELPPADEVVDESALRG
jgi:ABC-type amino acid transport substrate-binding protein